VLHATLGALEILVNSLALEAPLLTTFARDVVTTTLLLTVTLAGWAPFQIVGLGILSQGSRSILDVILLVFPFCTCHVLMEVISTPDTVVLLADRTLKVILSIEFKDKCAVR
jgi:hypothetical protein